METSFKSSNGRARWLLLAVLNFTLLAGTCLYAIQAVANSSYKVLPLPDPFLHCCITALEPTSWLGGVPATCFLLVGFISLDLLMLALLVARAELTRRLMSYVCWIAGICVAIQLVLMYLSFVRLGILCPYACLGSTLACGALASSCILTGHRIELPRSPLGRLLPVALGNLFLLGLFIPWLVASRAGTSVSVDVAAVRAIAENELLPTTAHSFGPTGGSTKFVIFVDGQCTFCADAFQRLFKYANRPDGFQLVVRPFPTSSGKEDAIAAEIAAERGKFWDYEAILYGSSTPPRAEQILEGLGWKRTETKTRIKGDSKLVETVSRDSGIGDKLGINGTPCIIEIVGSRRYVLSDLYLRLRFPL